MVRRGLALALGLTGLLLGTAPVRTLWASYVYGFGSTIESVQRAIQIDPDNYVARYLMAALLVQRGDCGRAVPHIEVARQLYPTASAPDSLSARCAARLPLPKSSAGDNNEGINLSPEIDTVSSENELRHSDEFPSKEDRNDRI